MIKSKNVFILNFQGGGGVAPQVRNSRRPLRRFFLKKKFLYVLKYIKIKKTGDKVSTCQLSSFVIYMHQHL